MKKILFLPTVLAIVFFEIEAMKPDAGYTGLTESCSPLINILSQRSVPRYSEPIYKESENKSTKKIQRLHRPVGGGYLVCSEQNQLLGEIKFPNIFIEENS
jgi:hypothetical protein